MVGNASWFPPGTAIVKRLKAALLGILCPLDSPTAEADGARDGGAILLLLNGGGARTAAITGVSHSRSFSLCPTYSLEHRSMRHDGWPRNFQFFLYFIRKHT